MMSYELWGVLPQRLNDNEKTLIIFLKLKVEAQLSIITHHS
jgi:hypothetical protein